MQLYSSNEYLERCIDFTTPRRGRTKGAWQLKRGGVFLNDLFTTINEDCLISCYEDIIEGMGRGLNPQPPRSTTDPKTVPRSTLIDSSTLVIVLSNYMSEVSLETSIQDLTPTMNVIKKRAPSVTTLPTIGSCSLF